MRNRFHLLGRKCSVWERDVVYRPARTPGCPVLRVCCLPPVLNPVLSGQVTCKIKTRFWSVGQRLECQSTPTGPGADRPELLAAVCGSGLALSRAWGQRGSVTNSSFSFNPYNINTHTAYMRGGLCASSVLRA